MQEHSQLKSQAAVTRPRRLLLMVLGYVLVAAGLDYVSAYFLMQRGLSLCYLPAALYLAVILRVGWRALPLAFLSPLFSTLVLWHGSGIAPGAALASALVSMVSPSMILALRDRFYPQITRFNLVRQTVAFIIVAIVATGLEGLAMGLVYCGWRLAEWTAFGAIALGSWMSTLLPFLGLSPLCWISFPTSSQVGKLSARELAGQGVVLLAAAGLAIWPAVLIPGEFKADLLYFSLLPILWAVMVWGGAGGIKAAFCVTFCILALTANLELTSLLVLHVQLFLVVAILTGLITGSVVSERRTAQEDLRYSQALYHSLVETLPQCIFRKDREGRFLFVNRKFCEFVDRPREKIEGLTDEDLFPPAIAEKFRLDDRKVLDEGTELDLVEENTTPDLGKRFVRVRKVPVRDEEGSVSGVQGIFWDITDQRQAEEQRRQNEVRVNALLHLHELRDARLETIAEYTQERAIELTGSRLGYIALMNDDETVLTMHSWSRSAMQECQITNKPIVYPVSTTGLWGEAVRQRRPVITNDYSAPNPWKKGTPSGHVPLMRHMNVPLFQGDRIVLVAGVANKETSYDDNDVRQLTLMMQGFWTLLQRLRAGEALRESQRTLATLLSNLPGMAYRCRFDQHYTMEFVSEGCFDLTGFPPEDLVQNRRAAFGNLILADDRQMVWNEAETALAKHEAFERTYRIRTAQASLKWVREMGRGVFNQSGELMAIEGFISDITDRKQAEEEHRLIENQMQQTQKLESLGVLAGGVAHDFNNLLTAILGHADLARQDLAASTPAHENVSEIMSAARRAADLCKQMLAYSGRGQFLTEDVCLNQVIQDMTQLLAVSISKKILMRYDLAPQLPLVRADRMQMRQVVVNLVVNAAEAIGDQNGLIQVQTRATNLAESPPPSDSAIQGKINAGQYVALTVTDTGCGMDRPTQDRVFEPFFSTKFTGRGLGLSAVLGIVRGHQGAIRVNSHPGKGSSFQILLPVANINLKSTLAPSPAAAVPAAHEGTVLLVDDEPAVRTLARRMLLRLGYQVHLAMDGFEAVAVYRENAPQIQCVILDLTMPRMDGEETFRALLQINPEIKVIISSGYSEQDVAIRFAGHALSGFIQKPYEMDSLANTLKNTLKPNGHPV
jgi:PAS domain S-box-containing protein